MKKSIAVLLILSMLLSTSAGTIVSAESNLKESQVTEQIVEHSNELSSQMEEDSQSSSMSSEPPEGGEGNIPEDTSSDTSEEEREPSEEVLPDEDSEQEVDKVLEEESVPFTGGAQLKIQLNRWKGTAKPVVTVDGEPLSEKNGIYSYSDPLENDLTEKTVKLTISGEAFVTQEQEVVLEKGGITHLVFTNDASILSDQSDAVNPGFLLFGDFTGDGKIDENDFSAMAERVENGEMTLQALSLLPFMKSQKALEAKPIIMLMPGTVQEAKPDENTNLTGDAAGLANGSGNGVSLTPKDGALISEDHPVSISMMLKEEIAPVDGFVISASQQNGPTAGTIEVELEDGSVITAQIHSGTAAKVLRATAAATAIVQKDGSIVVNLGTQVAVKKVTITVTGTSGSNKLTEISSVEFLNGMENRIPEPELNIPSNVKATVASESFTVHWDAQRNVTGYEVFVTKDGKTEKHAAQSNSLTVTKFGEKDLLNGETYEVQVKSVNGDWSSALSDKIAVTPEANRKPPAPENISLKAGATYIDVSWKKMKDTDSYQLYYRQKGDDTYQKVEEIKGTNYRIADLENETEYEIYLTGTNPLGTGAASAVHTIKTISVEPAITSNYKLINIPNEVGQATAHIESVSYPNTEPESEFAVVDHDYSTSWIMKTWDAGGYNQGKPSPIITFDQAYEMDRLVVVADDAQAQGYFYAKTQYWDAEGNAQIIDGQFAKKTSTNGKTYYEFNYKKPFRAKKIQVNFALYSADNNGQISIAEMKFYHYDSLEAEINDLFTDDMHVSLKEDVTQETIHALRERANTPDEVSGELHPKQEVLLIELQTAEDILNHQADYQIISVDRSLTLRNSTAFAYTLNDFQPLNIVAGAGDELLIFAGQDGTATGEKLPIQLVFTQYHAEASAWQQESVQLVQGKNVITVPTVTSSGANEQGGSVYLKYTGASTDNQKQISVRVSGGTPIAALNVRNLDDAGKLDRIKTYLQQLNEQVVNLQQAHTDQEHTDRAYQDTTCYLNSTEIGLDDMLYSIPATQVMSGLQLTASVGGLSESELNRAANQMMTALEAMDQLMIDTYKIKGIDVFSNSNGQKKPTARLNIRYSTMFDGAFMYAGGKHIGIEYGSVSGLMNGTPITTDDRGKYTGGTRFGWGIAHEIGHVLDTSGLIYGETTNNIISQFNQTQDTADTSRIPYDSVYKKVTSGTVGIDSNVFVNLGMFWQLHMAYDKNYSFQNYDNYAEQLANNFYSRLYSYQRQPATAPNGLTLSKDRDQDFIRLASAAAGKDLTEFFTRWGLLPNEETTAYLSKFPKEERAIYYLNDAAREYTLAEGDAFSDSVKLTASVQHSNANAQTANRVELTFGVEGADQSAILGYEIKRNGQSVAFVTGENTSYTDVISTVNNRVFRYEITAYDQYLNPTDTVKLDPIKVKHDGSVAKDKWDITTNMTSQNDQQDPDQDSCTPIIQSAIAAIKDNDFSTSYTGKAASGTNPYWIVDLKAQLPVSGVKLNGAASIRGMEYEVLVNQTSSDPSAKGWVSVKSGSLKLDADGAETIFFNREGEDHLMYTYDASYLMFRLKDKSGKEITISEFDIIGLPGDNLELLENGIGKLSKDFDLGDGEKIPAGSLIFTGSYTGNPAYNVVKLYNQDNQLIGGTQIIFASVPEQGALGNVSDGTWVYYIEPQELEKMTLPTQVFAELYRVDDALTNENERLVSDTLPLAVPAVLPDIELQGSKTE